MLTLDEIKAAYEKTGLGIGYGKYYQDGCACALSAVIADRHGIEAAIALQEIEDSYASESVAAYLDVPENKTNSFMRAFDGRPKEFFDDSEWFKLGREARLTLQPKDLR